MNRDEIIATIRSLPNELEPMFEGLSDDQVRWRPAPDEWSILEVCCHLRDSAEIEITRHRRLASEDNPTLEPYDQEALAIERNYQGDDINRVLRDLHAFWGGLADLLQGLSEEEWERSGFHPETGPTSIADRAQRNADHGRLHIEQIRARHQQLD